MAVILEVKAGPLAGKRVAVMGGQTVTVGRMDRASFSVPHDTFMSSTHFAVEYGPKGCVLTDKKSSNGTFVNGNRVAQALLKSGDEIRSGETLFAVRFVDEDPLISRAKSPKPEVAPLPVLARNATKPPERTTHIDSHVGKERSGPLPFASDARQQQLDQATTPAAKSFIKIGNWTLAFVPDGWIEVGEYGIQRNARDVFPSNVVATEEPLGPGLSLQEYVESQLTMLRQYLRQPRIEASIPPKIHGAEESMAIEISYQTKDGQAVFYRRVYVRADRKVGVLALTTLQSELVQVRSIFDSILSAARFNPSANVER
jgi:pSer/pThr/pTyr-binding forkhead associated (FHA) protein